MKRITIIMVVAIVISICGMAKAINMWQYTFNGYVTSISDGAGLITAQFGPGFGVNSPVSYTFIVDYDAQATKTFNDGSVYTYVWSSYRQFYGYSTVTTYRYADFISGDVLHEAGGGSHNAPGDVSEYNVYSYYDVSSPGLHDRITFIGGSDDERINISLDNISSSSMTAGTTGFNGYTYAYDSSGSKSQFNFSSTLADVAQIPEPVSAIFYLIGGAFIVRRRK